MMKRVVKIVLITILAIIVIIPPAAILMLQTRWAKHLIATKIEKYSPQFINGILTIESIEGNFANSLKINGLTLVSEGDTVATLGEATLKYRLWPLLMGRIDVDSIKLSHINLNIVNDSVNGLNLMRIALPSEADTTQKSTPVSLKINVNSLIIDPLHVSLAGFNAPIPTEINNVKLYSSAKMWGTDYSIIIDTLAAKANGGWPELKRFALEVNSENSKISVNKLTITTTENKLAALANYESEESFDGEIHAGKLNVHEFIFLMPDVALGHIDSLYFDASNEDDKLMFAAGAMNSGESVKITGTIEAFSHIFADDAKSPFTVTGKFSNITANRWLTTLPPHIHINGSINVSGVKPALSGNPIRINADFDNSSFEGISAQTLILKGNITDKKVDGSLNVAIQNQSITSDFNIDDWQNSQLIAATAVISNFDGMHWPGKADVRFDNATLNISGTGNSMSAKAKLKVTSITTYGVKSDSLCINSKFNDNVLNISNMHLFTTMGIAIASGHYNLSNDSIDATLNAALQNILLPIDSTSTLMINSADASMMIDGTATSPRWNGKFTASNIGYDSLKIADMKLITSGKRNSEYPLAKADIEIGNTRYGNYLINSTSVNSTYENNRAGIDLSVTALDTIGVNASLTIIPGDTIKIDIPVLKLNAGNIAINNQDTIKFRNSGSAIWVDSFGMKHTLSGVKLIEAKGVINPLSNSDFNINTTKFDLALLRPFIDNMNIDGDLTANIDFEGTPNNHKIKLSSTIDSLLIDRLLVNKITISGDGSNSDLSVATNIFNVMGDKIEILLRSKHFITQDSLNFTVAQKPEIVLESTTNKLPLAYMIPPELGMSISKGLLSYKMKIYGDLDNPLATGFIRIDDAAVKIPSAGADFTGMNMSLQAHGNRFTLDTMLINSAKGKLLMQGEASFADGLLKPVSDINMTLKTDNFRLRRRNMFDIAVDADAAISVKEKIPHFKGAVKVLNSSFNVDELMVQAGPDTYKNDVLLVSSIKKLKDEEHAQVIEVEKNNTSLPVINFGAMSGDLKLSIPHNTWIKGDNMSIELRGDLDISVNGTDAELFGSLNVNRGYYSLYGRKLQISKGNITFEGGRDINPRLDMEAQYIFRSADRRKLTLHAVITGKMLQPEIAFSLDGNEITQGNAVGYLVFGKPMSELGAGGLQLSDGGSGDAVSGLVSSQLSKLIGSTLSLDVVEIDASDNWENSSFVVGKYITQNLFVIYQRSFGKATDQDIAPQKVIMEYELNRHLFFRLESGDDKGSGIDIIFKTESKK